MSFYQDIQDKLIPKKAMILKLMRAGIPFIKNESTANFYFEDFNVGALQEKIGTRNSIEDISIEMAMNSPFGKKSTFYIPPKEDFSLSRKYGVSKGLKRF